MESLLFVFVFLFFLSFSGVSIAYTLLYCIEIKIEAHVKIKPARATRNSYNSNTRGSKGVV